MCCTGQARDGLQCIGNTFATMSIFTRFCPSRAGHCSPNAFADGPLFAFCNRFEETLGALLHSTLEGYSITAADFCSPPLGPILSAFSCPSCALDKNTETTKISNRLLPAGPPLLQHQALHSIHCRPGSPTQNRQSHTSPPLPDIPKLFGFITVCNSNARQPNYCWAPAVTNNATSYFVT